MAWTLPTLARVKAQPGVEGGAEPPLARGEGLAVAAGDGEITENIAHADSASARVSRVL